MKSVVENLISIQKTDVFGKISLMRNENFIIPKIDFSELNPSNYPCDEELKLLLSKKHNVDKDQILIGCGSTELLDSSIRTFLKEGMIAKIEKNTYSYINKMVERTGAEISEHYGDVCICVRPNNPTGEFNEIKNLYELVIFDEAYIDYYGEDESMIGRMDEYLNVIITRTFSKFYGLAGLRIGYLISSKDIVEKISKIKNNYSASVFSIHAAIQVLNDVNFQTITLAKNLESINILLKGLIESKIEYMAPCANFISAKIPNIIGDFALRDLSSYRDLKGWSRITTSTKENMEKFAIQLKESNGLK